MFFEELKAVESGEGDNQVSSYLMLTSAAGLNIIRHLQENSLCELALQYLVEVRLPVYCYGYNDNIAVLQVFLATTWSKKVAKLKYKMSVVKNKTLKLRQKGNNFFPGDTLYKIS